MHHDALDRLLIGELTTPPDERIARFVSELVADRKPLGVIFYGSGLRRFDLDGLFDFYVILDKLDDWPQHKLARWANRYLPPNVVYEERFVDGAILRAKVAFMTLAQFQARALPTAMDTTIWARFVQPVRLVWSRDSTAADALLGALRHCTVTAAGWAARLSSGSMPSDRWWGNLFACTYAAELRVETASRGGVIMSGVEARFAAILPLAWRAGGVSFSEVDGLFTPHLHPRVVARGRKRWTKLASRGRWLNIARLVKAAFTFKGGATYLAWKIERHSTLSLNLSPFEARHPLLCLPWLLWRARRILLRPTEQHTQARQTNG